MLINSVTILKFIGLTMVQFECSKCVQLFLCYWIMMIWLYGSINMFYSDTICENIKLNTRRRRFESKNQHSLSSEKTRIA